MTEEDRAHYSFIENGWKPDWTIVEPDAEQLQVLDRIENEFASDGENPGRSWVQAEMLDNHEPPEIVVEGASVGHYRRWQEVPDGLFARFPQAGWFLDDAGMRFYLPAIMRWSLRWGLHSSAPLVDENAERALKKLSIVELMTPVQRDVAFEWNRVHLPDHLRFKQ